MVNKLSQKNAGNSVERLKLLTLIKGVLLAYIITIPFFTLFSLILSYTNFPETYISTAVMLTTIISIALASSSTSKCVKSKGWFIGAMVGLLYMLILYIFSGLVFGNFLISRYLITMTLICITTGSVGGIIGVNVKTVKRKKTKFKSGKLR